jgi:hypothetical protein
MQLQYKIFIDGSRGPLRAACKAGLPQGAILMMRGIKTLLTMHR